MRLDLVFLCFIMHSKRRADPGNSFAAVEAQEAIRNMAGEQLRLSQSPWCSKIAKARAEPVCVTGSAYAVASTPFKIPAEACVADRERSRRTSNFWTEARNSLEVMTWQDFVARFFRSLGVLQPLNDCVFEGTPETQNLAPSLTTLLVACSQ